MEFRRTARRTTLLLLCALVLRADSAGAQDVRIAAASDLQAALPAITARFERETGHSVAVSFGSSGNFFSQLQNGAPFDVFLSADIDYPKRLESAGLAEPRTLYQYATGILVLWTRRESGVDIRQGLDALTSDRVRRIAIANPEHAPYGRAAVAALQGARLYERVRAKFVFGENVSQAAQFVQSGNAQAGLIPLALALSAALTSAGDYFTVPASLYPPIDQAAIVLRSSRKTDAARAFVDYLKRADIIRALTTAGFGPPRAGAPR